VSITSGQFVLFLFATLIIYYLLPRRPQNYWLLFVSYIFCVTWAWEFALVLLVVTVVNFLLAPRLKQDDQGRRGILWLGIVFNGSVLIFFRTADFFVPQLVDLIGQLGIEAKLGTLQILLPIGLSFYVVENISYLLDVYRGQTEAATDPVDFALYLAYFPKLLAGPIERANTFLPKLRQHRIVDNDLLARSFTLVVVGLFRKVLIADTLSASIPWDVFEAPGNFAAIDLWAWLFVYGFALYNDFAGYTSIVRGISELFGIELSFNFRQPYFSRNFGEFWNSWHVTLSHWLRDYIYFPSLRFLLRRNSSRRNVANLVIPPMVTMLVSGLWHGFSIHMLVWGGLHGLYQIGERILSLSGPVVPPDRRPKWRQILAMGIVFILVMWAWVPFRVEMPMAIEFWKQLLSFGEFSLHYRRLFFAAGYVLASVALDIAQRYYRDEVVFLRWPRLVQAALLATVVFLLLIVSQGDNVEPFVYQGF
jgi:D-alanyl-lipoteichoic acid acyltransferase DltB (MBOAT superfamily)